MTKSMSPKAKKFISMKIKKNRKEGYDSDQSIAMAYAQARKKGYKVPAYKKKRRR